MKTNAYLVLENGSIFKGERFGATTETVGEIVFTTGMTGYLETLTDKSYYGQIIVQTFPLIGNYGVIPSDFESGSDCGEFVHAKGYIVKDWCQEPSNFRNEGDLDTFLKAQNVVGLCGIDTRALTRIIRSSGVMNGMIVDSLENTSIDEIKAYKVKGAVARVSSNNVYTRGNPESSIRVALLDLGTKESIIHELINRSCEVYVFPHYSSAEDIMKICPDGIMLSSGPGDPVDNMEIVETIKELLKHKIPMFGICLGHHLLALANGFNREKLKFGHRGANQPVKDQTTGRVYITSQNHGYTVERRSIDHVIACELFINVNDQTNEGLEYINAPAFSSQFHPEACAGPLDTSFLFDRFINMMTATRRGKNAVGQ